MKFFIDNGAYCLKIGQEGQEPATVFNCISSCKKDLVVAPKSLQNTTEVLRPFERGVLVDPELQLKIWKGCLPIGISQLVVTSPLY